jgi:hypothetical protein
MNLLASTKAAKLEAARRLKHKVRAGKLAAQSPLFYPKPRKRKSLPRSAAHG